MTLSNKNLVILLSSNLCWTQSFICIQSHTSPWGSKCCSEPGGRSLSAPCLSLLSGGAKTSLPLDQNNFFQVCPSAASGYYCWVSALPCYYPLFPLYLFNIRYTFQNISLLLSCLLPRFIFMYMDLILSYSFSLCINLSIISLCKFY